MCTQIRKQTDVKDVSVLIVDDDDNSRLSAKLVFEGFSHKFPARISVDTAASGKEAVRKAKEHQYDVILMDLMMPEVDGREATRRIRKTRNGNHPVIYAYSCYDNMTNRDRNYESGMDGTLDKVLTFNSVKKVLENV